MHSPLERNRKSKASIVRSQTLKISCRKTGLPSISASMNSTRLRGWMPVLAVIESYRGNLRNRCFGICKRCIGWHCLLDPEG